MQVKRKSNYSIVLTLLLLVLFFAAFFLSSFAWFASNSSTNKTLSFGGAVIVVVSDETNDLSDNKPISVSYPAGMLLPGMKIQPYVYSTILQSSTTAIARARLEVSVSGLTEPMNQQLNTWFNQSMYSSINAGWALNEEDGWYYFLGAPGMNAMIMQTHAMESSLTTPMFGSSLAEYAEITQARTIEDEDTMLASISSASADAKIPFLVDPFRVPTSLTTAYATAQITISFYVEVMQDYLVEEVEDSDLPAPLMPTLKNAKRIMDSLSTTHDEFGNLI